MLLCRLSSISDKSGLSANALKLVVPDWKAVARNRSFVELAGMAGPAKPNEFLWPHLGDCHPRAEPHESDITPFGNLDADSP